MNKELQDLAWNCLSLEVKKEVKRQYQIATNDKEYYTECTLEYLFGIDNLTSDAEGEDMLTVSAITVREMYAANERIKTDASDNELGRTSDHINHVLRCLFGSKCLPDKTASESKPFKYSVGQKVILHFYGGEVSTITEAFNDGRVWNKYKVKMLPTRVWNENELDPYEEPKPAEPKDGSNYSEKLNSSDHISDPTKMVDNIIKEGFSKERRLNIGVQVLCAIIPKYQDDGNGIGLSISNEKDMIKDAFRITDALIAESEKGSK